MSKTKWILLTVIGVLVLGAVIGTVIYIRKTTVDIEITCDKEKIAVGTDETVTIRAVAKGRYDGREFELTPEIDNPLDTSKTGTYEITVKAKKYREEKTVTFAVNVVDEVPPVIELYTQPEYFTLPGRTYTEEGFSASDAYDGDITDRVVRDVSEDRIVYSVTDSSGNRTEAVREIIYSDPIAPEITVLGEQEITQERRYPYEDAGATAVDNYDGDITDRIVVSGSVDTTTIGDYVIEYSATDTFGNVGTANRIIHIIERSKPIGEEEEAKGKVIYLTFDDGPSGYTSKLLDVLDKYNVKATFFVCNNGLDWLIEEEYKRGHTVAVHGWTHDYKKLYSSVDGFYENFYKMQDRIYELTGERPTLLRFPGGSSNAVSRQYCKGIMTTLTKDVEEKGLHYFDWNVLAGDSEAQPISTEQVYKNVINGILYLKGKPAVVLQHDIKGFSVNAVEDIIKWGLENGYTFLPLDETSYGAHQRLNN